MSYLGNEFDLQIDDSRVSITLQVSNPNTPLSVELLFSCIDEPTVASSEKIQLGQAFTFPAKARARVRATTEASRLTEHSLWFGRHTNPLALSPLEAWFAAACKWQNAPYFFGPMIVVLALARIFRPKKTAAKAKASVKKAPEPKPVETVKITSQKKKTGLAAPETNKKAKQTKKAN